MTEFLNKFPDKDTLLNQSFTQGDDVPKVNGHIHTPYSFSAFADLEQAFRIADEENVRVLGINDFNTFDGYREFYEMSVKYKVFPLFNIEFMGLLQEEQEKGIRVNDPANPGRIYFSGKGLSYNVNLSEHLAAKLEQVKTESLNQTRQMLEKSSEVLQSLDKSLSLNFDEIVQAYTRGMLRERHIAKAIRKKIYKKYTTNDERKELLSRLFGGKEVKSGINDAAGIENEIRSNLLKSGGSAYVKEDPRAFLPLDDIILIIREAGGIPCYPVLLDDSKGNYTEYESDKETLYHKLQARNIFSLELIPGRNELKELKSFVEYFHEKGFIITFGTEHNTPELAPLTVSARENVPLDETLKNINYEGACIIAAHQFFCSKGDIGLADPRFQFTRQIKKEYIELGATVIKRFLKNPH
jgi:hypothetical protein